MVSQNEPAAEDTAHSEALGGFFVRPARFEPIHLLVLFVATSGISQWLDRADLIATYQEWGLPHFTAVSSSGLLIICALLAGITRGVRFWIGLAGLVLFGLSLGSLLNGEDDAVIGAAWNMGPFLAFLYCSWRWPAHTQCARVVVLFVQWMFGIAAIMNFIGFDDYRNWGFPSWWNYVSASYEMGLVLLLSFRSTQRVASVCAVALMLVILATIVLNHAWRKLVDLAYYIPCVMALASFEKRDSADAGG